MKKASAISMILVLMVSTIGFSVSDCCMGEESGNATCSESNEMCACGSGKMDSNCCHAERHFIQLHADYNIATSDFHFEQKLLAVLVAFIPDIKVGEMPAQTYCLYYKPPIPNRNLAVLFQSFLI